VVVLAYLDHVPRIGEEVTADPQAAVIGRAELGARNRLLAFATLRADGERIRTGADCWFGEASTVHISDNLFPALVGARVTVGRFGLVHACTVGDDCVVGEHAVVMDGSEVGPGSVIAAESVVPLGKTLPGGWLYAGAPAQPVAPLDRPRLDRLHRMLRSGSRGEADAEIVFVREPAAALRQRPGTGLERVFAEGAYVAPTARVAGEVRLAPRSSLWFAVEADAGRAVIEIGEAANVQDNSRLYAGGPGEDIRIGPRATVGHNVRIFPSVIEADALIGMGSIVGSGSVVRAGACLAAGSVASPGTEIEAGYVWSGRPARASRPLSARNREIFSYAVDVYVTYAANYLRGARR